jgi:hypothetical protein
MNVLLWSSTLPPVDEREVLRYMRCKEANAAVDAMLQETLREVLPTLTMRLCYCRVPVTYTETGAEIGGFYFASNDLLKALNGANEALCLAATSGLGLDRLIARYGHISPVRALCAQCIGTERTEALCDAFVAHMNDQLATEGLRMRPRFSPGYGDLSLTAQRELFALLSPDKHVGITLTRELLMSPTKSVTAIAGIEVIK